MSAPYQALSLLLYLLNHQFLWLPGPVRCKTFSLLHLPAFQVPHYHPLALVYLSLIANFWIKFLCSVSLLGYGILSLVMPNSPLFTLHPAKKDHPSLFQGILRISFQTQVLGFWFLGIDRQTTTILQVKDELQTLVMC